MTDYSIRKIPRGIIVPMATLFDASGEIDIKATAAFAEWLIERGVRGLYPGSGCGEVWKLTAEERRKLTETVIAAAAGAAAVIPGTGAGSTREAIGLTRHARDAGANAAVVWPPYFMGTAYSADAVFDHFREIAESVEIPIVVYDSPEITGYPLTAGLVARLAEIENITAVKDSTGNMHAFADLLCRAGDSLDAYQGWDSLLLPSLAIGARGGILSTANVIPELAVKLFNDFEAGRIEAAQAGHAALVGFVSADPWARDQFQATKELLGLRGISGGRIRRPWFSKPFSDADKQVLAAALQAAGF